MIYLLFSVLFFNIAVYVAPKHLDKQEIYSAALFCALLGIVTDTVFDLKYNLYGYFEKGLQLSGFLSILGLYPSSGILFLNFFPIEKSFIQKIFYITCWTVFCLFYEWTAIKSGFFYHNGWTFFYSLIVYPVLLCILLLHLFFLRILKK